MHRLKRQQEQGRRGSSWSLPRFSRRSYRLLTGVPPSLTSAPDSFRREIDSARRTRGNRRVTASLAPYSLLMIKHMRAVKLNSSLISRVAYDEEAEALSIWFRETGRYVYFGVPRVIY